MIKNNRRLVFLLLSMVMTFIALRVSLQLSPNSNFDIGPYNIHHLFTGLVLITLSGIPLVILKLNIKLELIFTSVFGIGLGMALDELVYLITTDGSDASYLLPISLWGGIIVIGLTSLYALFVNFVASK